MISFHLLDQYKLHFNHWLEGKGKTYQYGKPAQDEIWYAYQSYLNESQTGIFSSMESNPTVQKCKAVPKRKLSHNELLMEKGNSVSTLNH